MSELNDPRVLFAAERTLLAWNRTSIALIAFGFVIERSAIFARELFETAGHLEPVGAIGIGLAFVALGVVLAIMSIVQYEKTLRTLNAGEIPRGYAVRLAVYANAVVAALGIAMAIYLLLGELRA